MSTFFITLRQMFCFVHKNVIAVSSPVARNVSAFLITRCSCIAHMNTLLTFYFDVPHSLSFFLLSTIWCGHSWLCFVLIFSAYCGLLSTFGTAKFCWDSKVELKTHQESSPLSLRRRKRLKSKLGENCRRSNSLQSCLSACEVNASLMFSRGWFWQFPFSFNRPRLLFCVLVFRLKERKKYFC